MEIFKEKRKFFHFSFNLLNTVMYKPFFSSTVLSFYQILQLKSQRLMETKTWMKVDGSIKKLMIIKNLKKDFI